MAKKTTTVKKAKTSGKVKTNPAWESMAKELRGLIPKLDAEGLAFLVEQARVHLYNMQVDELNSAAIAADAAASRRGSLAGKSRAATPAKSPAKLRIDGSESGSSYYIYYGNSHVMFSRGEMIHLVKIANGPGTDLEIRERLYNWFERERKDVFATVPMESKFDGHLKALVGLLKKTFKLQGGRAK